MDCADNKRLTMHRSPLLERRELALGPGAELFYDDPVEIVRGEGCYLFDPSGRRYLDLYNNVPCVGHGNRAVAEAMATQQATLNVHNRYLHEGIVTYAERLCALHHDGIESVVFCCTGTEANEVALAMARAVTGQAGIVCSDAAYHGNAGLVAALTEVGSDTAGAAAMVRGFPYPDCYRPLLPDASDDELCAAYLERVAAAIARLKRDGHGLAAFIVCSIFANEGLPRVPADFLAAATELVHREGGLVIGDEVQCGFGRTGHWWGYEAMGFTPDIVVMGKPMGNGLPLAAAASSRENVATFRRETDYFNTFASTPLQAAVGMTVLDEIERLALVDNAASTGAYLLNTLQHRLAGTTGVGDIRGCGLFLAVEIVRDSATREPDPGAARQLANRFRAAGILLGAAGVHGNILKLRPPLVFGRADAEPFLEACDAIFGNDLER
jgi:4-aminobutyrate aminotransferase-like enzyme